MMIIRLHLRVKLISREETKRKRRMVLSETKFISAFCCSKGSGCSQLPHGGKEQPKRITKHKIFIWVNK